MHERAPSDIVRLAVDAVRVLSMDAVQRAESGHPGTPMALAPVGYALFHRHLRHDPADPRWIDRDRFVLSAGHASMLLYSLLHLSGYDLTLDDIRAFRQWDAPTAGHPEYGHAPGVETTTGPLGQGVANSVGMALAERWLAHRFNRPGHDVVDHRTFALCSDGDLMEGISHEAAALAGHQRLGKLTWIFDDNRITIDGGTELSTSSDQAKRFEAYGWYVVHVHDGNDLEAIDRALEEAEREADRPTLVVLRTTIAYGSPGKAGTSDAHGAPLGADEVEATKRNLGYPSLEPFHVDERARTHWAECIERGARLREAWDARFSAYRAEHPEAAEELLRAMTGELPAAWDADVPDLSRVERSDATRGWSGKVIQGVAAGVPNLIGGSADLAGSNKTDIGGADSMLPATPGGRTVHYGIREHAMGAVMNGMALHGGVRPFGGTFLIFSDYMRPAIRLAALMGQPVIYVFSHDSIGLGEDGPTHQPVEQLASLRAVPNLLDLRPADAAETEIAWRVMMERRHGPSWIALSRQKVPVLERARAGAAAAGSAATGSAATGSAAAGSAATGSAATGSAATGSAATGSAATGSAATGSAAAGSAAAGSGVMRAASMTGAGAHAEVVGAPGDVRAALDPAADGTAAGSLLAPAEGLRRGGYVLAEASDGMPSLILIASGAEVALAVQARETLEREGAPTRVVSLPSWYLFARQERTYRDEVLPPSVRARISVEAGSTFGWARWVGPDGRSIGLDRFGASAPAEVLFERFGFTADAIVEAARALL